MSVSMSKSRKVQPTQGFYSQILTKGSGQVMEKSQEGSGETVTNWDKPGSADLSCKHLSPVWPELPVF